MKEISVKFKVFKKFRITTPGVFLCEGGAMIIKDKNY